MAQCYLATRNATYFDIGAYFIGHVQNFETRIEIIYNLGFQQFPISNEVFIYA